jgi:3-phenylpropionate/cinnamic acid dioxygenase small subunit
MSTPNSTLLAEVTAFLYQEVLALDERRWEDWLAHFAEDSEYWVPAWKSEDELTSNPHRELSLIYYSNRSGLEDRAWRVKSGRSVASAVLPRTQHVINNVMVTDMGASMVAVTCAWTVQQYMPKEKTVEVFFGRYEQAMTRHGDSWLINKKKIILLNDYLPAKIDFYSF